MPRESFLKKFKKTVLGDDMDEFAEPGLDDGLDLESGVIRIDDRGPEQRLSTADVLRETQGSIEDSLVRGHGGKVFVLDLRPFFDAINANSGTKLGQHLLTLEQ